MDIKSINKSDVTTPLEETVDFGEDTLKAIAEGYKNEGNDEYGKKDFSKAIHFYTEGMKVNCTDDELNSKLYSNRATAHFYLGNYRDSLNDARAATGLQPDYLKAIVRGASACIELKQFEEAISWCDKGLAIDKTNWNLLELKTKAIKEQELQESINHAAVKMISKLPASVTKSPIENTLESDVTPYTEVTLLVDDGTLRVIAEAYKDKGNDEYRKKDFSKAIHFYSKGIIVNCKDDELNTKLYSNRAIVNFKLGNYPDSLNDARAATKLQPDYLKAIVRGASACVEMKQFEEAIMWCDKGLAIHKTNRILLELKNKAIKKKELQELSDEEGKDHSETQSEKDTAIISPHQELCQQSMEITEKSNKQLGQDTKARNKDLERAIEMYGLCGAPLLSRGEFRKAIDYYDQHLTFAKDFGDKKQEIIAYNSLGVAFKKLGKFRKAIHYHDQCLKIAKEMGDKAGEGAAYGNLGLAYRGLGNFKKAEEYQKLYLAITKEIGDKTAEGRTYGNLGTVCYDLGNISEGIKYYKLCLDIAKKVGDKEREGGANGGLGDGFFKLGNFKKAIQYFEQHLSISRALGNKHMEASACCNLGNAFHELGDVKESIKYRKLHLSIAIELGNKYEEGRAYGNLGNTFNQLGDYKMAIESFFQSLGAAEDAGNKVMKGSAYCNLGSAFFSLGDYKKAKEYHDEQLGISKDVGDRTGEGRACYNLANDYYHLGDFEKAVKYNELHLNITKEVGDRNGEGCAYDLLGFVYQSLGLEEEKEKLLEKAVEYHNKALSIAKECGNKAAEGNANGSLGSAFQRRGEIHKAISYYKRFLRIAKDVEDKKMEGNAYYSLAYCCELLGNLSEALEYYQSSVRSFNDVRSRLQSKDEWKIGFRNKHHLAYNGWWRILLKLDRTTEALFAAEEGRAQALADLMESQYGLQASRSRSLPVKDSDTLKCIFSSAVFQALDKGTITHWVLLEGRVVGFKRNEIEDDATAFFRSLIQSTYNGIGVRAGVSCEDRSMAALRKHTSPEEKSDEEVSPPPPPGSSLSTLYDIVIKPTADLIQGNELIIVPDGPLWLAPYAAFMDSNSKYLCESFQIRLIPSLTSLKMIKDCPEGYHYKSGALLVGDPWVGEVTDSEGIKFLEQLAFAKQEVEMIGKILKVTPVIGKEATKAAVLNRMSSVSLVHIAAHGCMETGEIALTPDPKRASSIPKKEDYVLTIKDVLSVKLRARLVVLSCCYSGRGEIKAEGVVGIARAFIGAGARSVLVTLWAIDDEATLEFMRSFYYHLVKGKRASESVNQAMKDLRESDKYSDVKYWAPFVLIGDDVTLELGAKE